MSKSKNRTVLITRPFVQAEALAETLKPYHINSLIEPMLTLSATPYEKPDYKHYDGIIITSVRVFEYADLKDVQRGMPIYCVGADTAKAAFDRGFENVIQAEGSVQSLIPLLDQTKKYVHLSGKNVHTSFDPQYCERIIVYRADQAQSLSDACIKALQQDDINLITFYSRRSAEAFLTLSERYGLAERLHNYDLLCISENVLNCARTYTWKNTYVAETANGHSMLKAITDILSHE